MRLEVFPDAAAVAVEAARRIAAEAREAVAARGSFTFAVSGGSTPWKMLERLAVEKVPWEAVHLFQVDERVAPMGDPDRNLTQLRESFLAKAPLPEAHVHAMPVNAEDLEAAARDYAGLLEEVAGAPPVLDLVHLGLGPDGHTASLVPGDPVCGIRDRDVAITAAPYQGRWRMTLTYPLLDRARCVLWLATGGSKVEMLARLLRSDASIPAGCVRAEHALVLADRDAQSSAR
jgi:6-phosphogluconolactonase